MSGGLYNIFCSFRRVSRLEMRMSKGFVVRLVPPLASLVIVASAVSPGLGFASVRAAEPAWPPSASLVVGEIVTGGVSASDEYVELYNAGSLPVDLNGLELVYVTASGTTVSRRATWTSPTLLDPGRHLLLANAAGVHVPLADAVYSGGLAATGGVIALRPVGGIPIDAQGWGEAANAFVEGLAAPAPVAGGSLERLPGGSSGNGVDTNDNFLDTRLEPAPLPQNMASAPVPVPTQPPSPLPSDPSGTVTPSPPVTWPPTPAPGTSPPASPTPGPSDGPVPSPIASPALTTVAAARQLPEGATVSVAGVLTTPPGLTDAGRGAYLQDPTGGIALYLSAGTWPALAMGSAIDATGTIDSRYGQITLRIADANAVTVLGPGAMPAPIVIPTGGAGEAVEATLVSTGGAPVGAVETLSDGFAFTIDDGSGSLRIIASTASGIVADSLASATSVSIVGVLGQRDSTGTGSAGYRLYLRSGADLAVTAVTPSPAPSGSPGDTTPPSATPAGTDSPSPSTSPTPSTAAQSIVAARALGAEAVVTVRGTITAEPGRILDDRTIAIQDATGGLPVRISGQLPEGLTRGRVVLARGHLARPYGNLELRVADDGELKLAEIVALPSPRQVTVAEVGEALEGQLVKLRGEISQVDWSSTGSISLHVQDPSGTAVTRVFLRAELGISRERFQRGQGIIATGVAGQRATGLDRPDGYRVWPRDEADLQLSQPPGPSPSATPSPRPTRSPGRSPGAGGGGRPGPGSTSSAGTTVSIAEALRRPGSTVSVSGIVTAPIGLLDADGRRVTVQDASGAILVRLPEEGRRPSLGGRLRAEGTVGTYYGAPQLEASDTLIDRGGTVGPKQVASGPFPPALEWQLVEVSGTVEELSRDGDEWRAELKLRGGGNVPAQGISRSGIPSTALAEGSNVTIVGLVRRPYPTATDRRLTLIPRSVADLSVLRGAPGAVPGQDSPDGSGASDGGGGGTDTGGWQTSGWGATTPGTAASGGSAGSAGISGDTAGLNIPEIRLRELPEHRGQLVRVGGIVRWASGTRLILEDGNIRARARLPEEVRRLTALLTISEPVNVVGRVDRAGDGGWEVVARTAADIGRVGRTRTTVVGPQVNGASPRASASQNANAATAPGTADGDLPWLLLVIVLVAAAAVTGAVGFLLRRGSSLEPSPGSAIGAPLEP